MTGSTKRHLTTETPRLVAALLVLFAGTLFAPFAAAAPFEGASPPDQETVPAASTAAAIPGWDEHSNFEAVRKILQARCAMPACHAGPNAAQGLRLEGEQIYRSTVNVHPLSDGRFLRVDPGRAERSLLYLKLLEPERGHYRGPRMPRGMQPLPEDEIARIRQWIDSFPPDTWGHEVSAVTAEGPITRTFQGSYLTNLPTTDPLGAGGLEFGIAHRFKAAARDAGSQGLYGLDSGAWISIELAYGLTDALDVGLRRTNLQQDVEGYLKWVPVRQEEGGPAVSLALRGAWMDARQGGIANATRYGAQAILARRFGSVPSLMLVPTFVSRTNSVDAADRRGTSAVGAGAELRFKTGRALTVEYIGQVGGVEAAFQGLSVGYSIATARHVFGLFATNTSGSQTDLYAPGGDLDGKSGAFRIGFNVSRLYNTRRP